MRSATDPTARGRRTVFGAAKHALVLLLVVPAGCSFILDFPNQDPGAAGAAGGHGGAGGAAGGGGGGGAGPMACFGASKGPTATAITWHGIPKMAGTEELVETTGLAYVFSQQELVMFGNTSNGLQAYDIPPGRVNQVYVIGHHDNGTEDLLLMGTGCVDAWQNRFATTRRIATDPTDLLLYGAATLPTNMDGNATWSFTTDMSNQCGMSGQLVSATASGVPAGNIPLEIDTALGPSPSPPARALKLTDGSVFDVDTSNVGALAWIGAGRGIVDGHAATDSSVFVTVSDEPDFNRTTALLSELPIDTSKPPRGWPGAIAFDESDRAWFGGSACSMPGGCADPALYLGHFAFGDTAPTLVETHAGDHSAITSIRVRDGILAVGGTYRGALGFRGVTFPTALGSIPFVAALDSMSGSALWTWPSADAAPSGDPTHFRSIVDMAISSTFASCGAIYVLGCASPLPTGYEDCLTVEPGKTTFLTKLDLATGQEIWSNTVTLSGTRDMFVPTAITSYNQSLWVAGTFRGEVEAWGQSLLSGESRESIVLAVSP